MDVLMERGRGYVSAALATPSSLLKKKKKAPGQCLQKSLEHKGEGTSGQPQPFLWSPLFWLGRDKEGTHWLRLPESWQEVCRAGPKHVHVDGTAPRWPSSYPTLGSQKRTPTHPALPSHRQFQ